MSICQTPKTKKTFHKIRLEKMRDEGATEKEIKSSYRSLAKRFHPDTNLGDAESEIKFQQVKTAYEVLTSK